MVYNCVTSTTIGSIIRYGTSDFLNDGEFDAGTETYYADVGFTIIDVKLKFCKVVDGVITEMNNTEKDIVRDATVKNVHTLITTLEPQMLGAGELIIDPNPFCTGCTTAEARTLAAGSRNRTKKIVNILGSGGSITVTCNKLEHAPLNQVIIPEDKHALLIYKGKKWTKLDGMASIQ